MSFLQPVTWLIAAIAIQHCTTCAAGAEPVADFYRGKTVTISVGSAAGGGYDTYSRVIARHMSRHIPGEPAIIVKNAPGAGGLVLANALYNVAPKDGTEFSTFNRTLLLDPLLGNEKAQFDPLRYTWLGSAANEVSTCVAWAPTGIKTIADLRAKELVTGATGTTTTDGVIYPRVSNALLGTRFRIVMGYPGAAEAVLAMERGETQAFCGWGYSSMEAMRPGWVAQGKINVLVQFGAKASPAFPGIPLATDLAPTPAARQIVELIVAPQLFARPYMAPPGVPAERATALRTAFERTMADPAFMTEAAERKLEIELVGAAEILAMLSRVYATPRPMLDEVRAMLK